MTASDVRVVRFVVRRQPGPASTPARRIVTGHPERSSSRPPLRLPHPLRSRRARCGSRPATPPVGTNPQNLQRRSTARCCASTDRGNPVEGNMIINGQTYEDLRLRLPQPAGHLVPPERRHSRSWSSTAPAATTRSRRSSPVATVGGTPSAGSPSAYNENVPMTNFSLGDDVLAPSVDLGLPDDRPVRRHVRQRRRLG